MKELKELYVALGRSVEQGDKLQLGIVIGQLLSSLPHAISHIGFIEERNKYLEKKLNEIYIDTTE
jgi:hypothetical protein